MAFSKSIRPDSLGAPTSREQSGFVYQVLEIRTDKPRGSSRLDFEVDILVHGDSPSVDFEDLETSAQIGPRHDNTSIKTSRSQESGVEHIGPVRRGDQDDPLVTLETVHLHQKLIEGLLALVVARHPCPRPDVSPRRRSRR